MPAGVHGTHPLSAPEQPQLLNSHSPSGKGSYDAVRSDQAPRAVCCGLDRGWFSLFIAVVTLLVVLLLAIIVLQLVLILEMNKYRSKVDNLIDLADKIQTVQDIGQAMFGGGAPDVVTNMMCMDFSNLASKLERLMNSLNNAMLDMGGDGRHADHPPGSDGQETYAEAAKMFAMMKSIASKVQLMPRPTACPANPEGVPHPDKGGMMSNMFSDVITWFHPPHEDWTSASQQCLQLVESLRHIQWSASYPCTTLHHAYGPTVAVESCQWDANEEFASPGGFVQDDVASFCRNLRDNF